MGDVMSGECVHVLNGHSDTVESVCYSPDGKTLASGSRDNTVRIWDVMSGECVHVLNGHSSYVYSVCYSPDGKTLASVSQDETVRIWDVMSGECVHVLNGHSSYVSSVCYSPDGKTLASGSGSDDATVRIWDVMSGECVSTESTLPDSFITSSTPLPYDGSGDVCVDVFSCKEVSVTYSSSTFYYNIVLVHRMNM